MNMRDPISYHLTPLRRTSKYGKDFFPATNPTHSTNYRINKATSSRYVEVTTRSPCVNEIAVRPSNPCQRNVTILAPCLVSIKLARAGETVDWRRCPSLGLALVCRAALAAVSTVSTKQISHAGAFCHSSMS